LPAQRELRPGSERAGNAAAIYSSRVEYCKANKVNPLTYLTYATRRQLKSTVYDFAAASPYV
jgi:hypothetical protein